MPEYLSAEEVEIWVHDCEKTAVDGDNYGSVLWKWVQDSLVFNRIIPDDTPEHVTAYQPTIQLGESEQTFLSIKGDL